MACGGAAERRDPPSRAAERGAAIPGDVERYVHRTFHRLPRSCNRRGADRRVLDQITTRFIGLYRRYPAPRFRLRIDDESGTMLSAILVLRYELAECSPHHAASIDVVLPPRVRRALRPLTPRAGELPTRAGRYRAVVRTFARRSASVRIDESDSLTVRSHGRATYRSRSPARCSPRRCWRSARAAAR
jgi:hypothetical protein